MEISAAGQSINNLSNVNQDIKYIEAVQKRKWNLKKGGNGAILPFHIIQEYENRLENVIEKMVDEELHLYLCIKLNCFLTILLPLSNLFPLWIQQEYYSKII